MSEGSGQISLGTLVVFLEGNATVFEKMLGAAEGHTKSSMDKMVSVSKVGAAAVVAALTSIATAAVYEFAKFDDAMTRSLSMMDGVNEHTRTQLEATARTVALTGRKSVEELAKSYGDLEDAGFNAEQSMKALGIAEQFASTHAIELKTAIKELTGTQAALGMVSKNAAENARNLATISDALTRVSQIGKGSTQEYAEALATSARVMKMFNVSIDEGLGVFASFADANIRGAEAGMLFNTVLKSLQTSALKQEEIWTRFGVAVYDAQGQMRPLANILKDLDGVMVGFSDEQKRATLELLGFNARVVTQIQSVMGASSAMKEYQTQMRNSAGSTAEAAARQESFSEQVEKLGKFVKDAALEIGSELVPILSELVKWVTDNTGAANTWREAVRFVADVLKTSLLLAVTGTMDLIYHLTMLIKAGALSWDAYGLVVRTVAAGSAKAFSLFVNSAIDGLNKLITAYNVVALATHNMTLGSVPKFTALDSTIENLNKGVADATKNFVEGALALKKMADEGRPSEEFMKRFEEAERKASEAATAAEREHARLAKTQKEAADAANKNAKAADGVAAAHTRIGFTLHQLTPEYLEFEQLTRDAFGNALEQVKKYEKVLAQGTIDAREFADATRQLVAASNEFVAPVKGMIEHTGNQGIDESVDLINQEKITQDHYQRQQAAFQKHLESLKATDVQARKEIQDLEDEATSRYLERMANFEQQKMQMLLGSASNTFSQLADIQATAFGKQSGIYKAMFAISKAFAIAEATVQLQIALAKAMGSLPFPANLIAWAQVMSIGAGIIANVQSVALSFEGGGTTKSGPRIGGVDGRGGFMAIMHPDEKVTDLTMEDSSSGESPVQISISQTFTGGVTEKDLAQHAATQRRSTIEAVTEGIRRAGGFRRAMQR